MLLPHLIRTRLGKGPDALRKASAGALVARRWLAQTFSRHDAAPRILFIFGCQRSGTTLLSRIFEGDARVCSYAEHSRALARPDHLVRTRSMEELEQVFRRCKGSLIVAKPLVESQRARQFLDYFPGSRMVWSYRHYREVVRSFVKLFNRAGVNIMKKILERADNWASESVSEDVRRIVERFYSPDMSLNDAAAIFWIVRNALYFDQHLDEDPRVTLCQYGTLVTRPDETMHRIYSFVEQSYPGSDLVGGVHDESRGLGRSLMLDPDVETLCREMWDRLTSADEGLSQSRTKT